MVRIDVVYQGDLRCEATHEPSGRTLLTDAPVDNHGKGESFSPTDLVATARALERAASGEPFRDVYRTESQILKKGQA